MNRSKHNRVGQVWCDEHWVYYVLESTKEKKSSKWWHHLCLRLDDFTTIRLGESRERPWGQGRALGRKERIA